MTVVEICVEDVAGVVAATAGGADRVELCRELWCGGLTPAPDDVAPAIAAAPPGGLQVLVRPRAGTFVFDRDEVRGMYRLVRSLRDATRGAPVPVGFTVGALDPAGTVDEVACAALLAAADGAPVTFHRAFDQVPDRLAALETLIGVGVDHVLTAGGGTTRADVRGLAELVRAAGVRITVLASGGLREDTVEAVLDATGATEVHMRAPARSGTGTDPERVASIVAAVRSRDARVAV